MHSLGNWNNYGTDSLVLEKNERSVSGKVDERDVEGRKR